jgi:hypothetical protein
LRRRGDDHRPDQAPGGLSQSFSGQIVSLTWLAYHGPIGLRRCPGDSHSDEWHRHALEIEGWPRACLARLLL